MENKKTTIEALLDKGKANGRLTTKEITDALEELDFDVDQINTFYDNCESLNIEIVEDMNIDADLKIGLDSNMKWRSQPRVLPLTTPLRYTSRKSAEFRFSPQRRR